MRMGQKSIGNMLGMMLDDGKIEEMKSQPLEISLNIPENQQFIHIPMTYPAGAGILMLTWLGVYWWDPCYH